MKWLLIALLCLPALATERSGAVRAAFQRDNPCPANGAKRGTCPGWVVDHIKPLACDGADKPFNLQWQTVADAKAKDKWERRGCSSTATK